MRTARLTLIAICAGTVFAQTNFYQPQSCHDVDKSSLDKFMKSVGAAGSGLSMLAVVAEDGHMGKLGAALGLASLAYEYWKRQSAPATVCYGTTPNGQKIELLGRRDVMQKPLTSLGLDYRKLTSGSAAAALLSSSPPQPQPVQAPTGAGHFDPAEVYRIHKLVESLKSSLHGSVTDILGHGLADATVLIIPVDNPANWQSLLTDSAGAFDSAVWSGEYVIHARADGYRDYVETTTVGISSVPLRISLFRR